MATTDPHAIKRPLERTEDGRQRFHGCSKIAEYEYLGKVGEGTFGEVSKARAKRTGEIVAMKKIRMDNEKDGFPITSLREIKLLKQLDHINILKLVEMAVERSKNASKRPSMFMVTPYMDHDLSGLLENPSVNFTEPQIKCYLKQLLEGCAYLHENKILHRDLKAANLLINNKGILQLADFGLARPYEGDIPKPGKGGGETPNEYTTLVVTRWYRAPELLLQLRKYTTAIDMWSVGCVFGEMFKRKPILAGNSDLNQAHLIFDLVGSPTEENMPGWKQLPGCEGVIDFPPRHSNLNRFFREQSPVTVSLMGEFMKLDWRKRINAIDALQHPYFFTPPLPAHPSDLPTFEESHELDRRKFRDQKSKPPPAPAGGAVGVGTHGELGIAGRPLPPDMKYNARHPGRPPYGGGGGGTGGGQGYNRRAPGPYPVTQNGGYPPDHRGHHIPRDMPTVPPHDESYGRRPPPPPQDYPLPPRPVPPEIDRYPGELGHTGPAYRDENARGGHAPRSRAPPSANPDHRRPERDRAPPAVDTYIPDYSSADPSARPPSNVLNNDVKSRRRDDRLPRRDDANIGGIDSNIIPPSGPSNSTDRRRSRSPIRDRDRNHDRDHPRSHGRDHVSDRDRERDRDKDLDRDRDRDRNRDRAYSSAQDVYRR